MPGADICIARLALIEKVLEESSKEALKLWCESVKKVSEDTYCPVDTGDLRDSCTMREIRNDADNYVIRIAYNTPYAIYVHEIPYRHKHGSRKYLSTPFKNATPLLLQALRANWEKVV